MQKSSIADFVYVSKTILFNQPIIQKFLHKVAVVVVLYEVVLLS
jgi:hypothetical protein